MMKTFVYLFMLCVCLISCNDELEELYEPQYSQSNEISFRSNKKPYVEVCGIKWAKGNLQYQTGKTSPGFMTNWSVADQQYKYFNLRYGRKEYGINQNKDSVDHFNWGVCGVNSLTIEKLFSRLTTSSICGRMFEDKYCTKETLDYDAALFGDLAYWASKGQYRLPTESEMKILLDSASYTPSYLVLDNDSIVYGYYFYTPDGERVVSSKVRTITMQDLDNGLFLPGAGFRDLNTDSIIRAGACGFYWHGTPNTEDASGGLYTLRFVYEKTFWSHDNRNYGRSIRPVYISSVQELPYVEICGVKWAKGNLQYSSEYNNNDGFKEGWRIAPEQYVTQSLYQENEYKQNADSLDLFNWGLVGDNFFSIEKNYPSSSVSEISGVLFFDRGCEQTATLLNANYGDIAYWASNGQWRLPSNKEISILMNQASRQSAVFNIYNRDVYGIYFTEPDGQQIISTELKILKEEDFNRGLFLPFTGNREINSNMVSVSHEKGFYWQGTGTINTNNCKSLKINKYSIEYYDVNRAYGRAIRPVYVGKPILQPEEKKEYVEVCGIKWAKGNLQYSIAYSELGFMNGWRIAPHQASTQYPVNGCKACSYEITADSMEVFNWGVCGKTALMNSDFPNCTEMSISGKLYKDKECKIIADYSSAQYGDLAYWATKGKWRLPTDMEMLTLYNKASRYPAYVQIGENQIFGMYYYTPKQMQIIETATRKISLEDLEKGLFLPTCGNREIRSSLINRVGATGYYWQATAGINQSFINSLKHSYYSIDYYEVSRSYGRSIRPVLYE